MFLNGDLSNPGEGRNNRSYHHGSSNGKHDERGSESQSQKPPWQLDGDESGQGSKSQQQGAESGKSGEEVTADKERPFQQDKDRNDSRIQSTPANGKN